MKYYRTPGFFDTLCVWQVQVQEAQVQMHTPEDVYDMLCVWQVQVQEAQVQMHTANTQGQADPYISLRQESFAIFNQMIEFLF
jgi:hypothetical protein